MWDILLANVEGGQRLAWSILTTKKIRLRTEYMGDQKNKDYPSWRTYGHHGGAFGYFFFSQFRQDGDIAAVTGKTGFETGDYELQVTMNRKNHSNPRNSNMPGTYYLHCSRPNCWACGTVGMYLDRGSERTRRHLRRQKLPVAPMNGQTWSKRARSQSALRRLLLPLSGMSHQSRTSRPRSR